MGIIEQMKRRGATADELHTVKELMRKYLQGLDIYVSGCASRSLKSINLNDIAGLDAATEDIREVYIERDGLRDEVEALRQFKTDICEVLGIGGNSHNDGIVKLLKANKERTRMEADDNRMYRDILDELKKYFKMTASHWKYSDIPHFIKCSHEFALEKKEDAEEQAKQLTEDICAALWVRPGMSTRDSILEEISKLREENEDLKEERDQRMNSRSEFARDILDSIHYTYYNPGNIWMLEQLAKDQVKRLYDGRKKQEEFTEEAASILGVQPGDLTLSDILDALKKLKREEQLDDMNSSIIADLKTERDKLKQDYLNEIGRRKTAERYISDAFEKIGNELDLVRTPDSIEAICDEIACFRNYRNRISCPKEFWEAICDIMEMDACDSTPSGVIGMVGETKLRLISVLALEPKGTTWTDIYEAIKAEQKDHCDLISESYKMKNEIADLKDKYNKETDRRIEAEEYAQTASNNLEKICEALGIECSPDVTIEYILDTIDDLRGKMDTYSHSFGFCRICEYLGIEADGATLSDIRTEIEKLKSWKTVAADHDKRRKHLVRRYKEEHERAVNLDKLYRDWKDKYEAYYNKTSNLTEQNESLMASYMAVKNTAIKQKDILKVVCRYLSGKDTMPDKDIVVRLNEMWTKEIGLDGLVEHFGAKVIREMIDTCDDEITERTRKDLGEMLST